MASNSSSSKESAIPLEIQLKLKHQFLVVRQQAIENLVAPLKSYLFTSLLFILCITQFIINSLLIYKNKMEIYQI